LNRRVPVVVVAVRGPYTCPAPTTNVRASDTRTTRRTVLASLAGAGAVALAGCSGGDDGGDGGDGGGGGDGGSSPVSESQKEAVDGWLNGTEVGGADDTYDGGILDRRDADEVVVEVGVEGNQAQWAFGPSAVAVSTGTTVRWEWTGQGGAHNVVADDRSGSDVEFTSGSTAEGSDVTYERSFEETAVATYYCSPHLGQGMKGAVVVV
jgi:halocyanin-like protein